MVRLFILVIEQLFLPNAGLVQEYIATECSQLSVLKRRHGTSLIYTFLDLLNYSSVRFNKSLPGRLGDGRDQCGLRHEL
jgi:hypothetical protein